MTISPNKLRRLSDVNMDYVDAFGHHVCNLWSGDDTSWPTVSSAKPQLDETIVAVMGATGTGKSSFARLVTGNQSILVGHGMHSSE